MLNASPAVVQGVRPFVGGLLALTLVAGMFTPALAQTVDTTPPPVPTNISPSHDATVSSTGGIDLEWSEVTDDASNPVTYEFEYSWSASTESDGSFSFPSGSIPGLGSGLSGAFNGAADGEFYWHVRAVDTAGNESDWSSTSHFTVSSGASADTTPPSTPTLLSPADDVTLTSSAYTSVDWSDATDDSGDPVTYEFEYSSSATVDGDGSFASVSGSATSSSSEITGISGAAEGEYYWHVRAIDESGNEGEWSSVFHFTIDNGSTPPPSTPGDLAAPGNLWPYDGQRLSTAEWTHAHWTEVDASSTPVTYIYQSSLSPDTNSDGSFVTPAYTSGTLTDNQIATPGTPEGTYYWHVKAIAGDGEESVWSTMTRVVVDNTPTGDLSGPAAPTHLHPANGAVMHPDDHDYVDWTTVTDDSEPVRYIYEYSWSTDTNADGSFVHQSFQSGALSDSRIEITDPEGRAEGTQYWHVRSIDAAGNVGPWSAYWSYTIDADATSTPGSGTATSSQTIVVREGDLETETDRAIAAMNNSGKWFFYNDENDTIDNTYGSFVTGPGTAPLGQGSAQMTATGTERHNLATYGFKNVALEDIMALTFSTYSQSLNNGATTSERAPYLHFNVDFENNDTWQRRLVFVPGDNGTVTLDTWQSWDAIAGGDALWRYSGPVWPGTSDAGSTLKTWDQILALYPNAETRSTDSWFGFRVGEPYPDGFTGNVDNFSITIANSSTTASTTVYDFEPTITSGGGGGGGSDDDGEVLGESDDNGGGSSTIDRNRNRNNNDDDDDGEVLGESTGNACVPLITTFMRMGQAFDNNQVNTLKNFLNGNLDIELNADGMFDAATTLAVNAFQLKYWDEVLAPWVPFGLATDHTPTGYVYKTTSWKINQLNCDANGMDDPVKPILP